jgi:hypothetical protein
MSAFLLHDILACSVPGTGNIRCAVCPLCTGIGPIRMDQHSVTEMPVFCQFYIVHMTEVKIIDDA